MMILRKYRLILLSTIITFIFSTCGTTHGELEPPAMDVHVQVRDTKEAERSKRKFETEGRKSRNPILHMPSQQNYKVPRYIV